MQNTYCARKRSFGEKSRRGDTSPLIDKKIAILGRSTSDIKLILELFLLNYGIRPSFYESEYNQYYQDAMFPNPVFVGDEFFVADTVAELHESVRQLVLKVEILRWGGVKVLKGTMRLWVLENER